MVVRKNISLESSHIKKIESLTAKHNGNLSAAIRDAIDLTDVAIHRYGSVEEAIIKITSEKKSFDGMEESILAGKNILISRPIFLWMLRSTKGFPMEKEIIEEVLDPLKIKTISDLDAKINELSIESGLNCQISLFCMDDINPTTATITISGENEFYRDFVAQLAVMFLAYNKGLDIEIVHKRATSTRIDLKLRENGTQPVSSIKHFGYLRDAMKEFRLNEEFWTNLFEIFSSVNYNIASLYKVNYEELLAGNSLMDAGLFESISKKHLSSIKHTDFLELLKKTEESLMIIDKLEILDNSINIYHNFKTEKALQNIRDYFISLLKANGHEYEAKYSSSLLILTHVCCQG